MNTFSSLRALIAHEEHTFFKSALDEELNLNIIQLKRDLIECSHNLIETEKQIIEFLHQIKYQSGVIEKQSSYPVQLSLDALASEEVHEAIIRIVGRIKTKAAASLPVAKSISLDQLDTQLQRYYLSGHWLRIREMGEFFSGNMKRNTLLFRTKI